jgi:hypothetical protein
VRYSLDTSGILDGWRHYPPDIFPPVWERFDTLITSGDARASDEVLRELKKKEGDETYAENLRNGLLDLPVQWKKHCRSRGTPGRRTPGSWSLAAGEAPPIRSSSL